MTDRDPWIDPEAEALLLEVARDPRSTLLKVERPRALSPVVASGGDLLVTHKTGLSSAERKLLDVYREEAAYLLRLGYWELWRQGGPAHSRGLFFTAPEQAEVSCELSDLELRIATCRDGLDGHESELGMIESALVVLRQGGGSLIDLAKLSLRLAPSISARTWIGTELSLAGDLDAAESAFEALARAPVTPSSRASALTSLATVQIRQGKDQEGHGLFRLAAALNPSSPGAVLSWFWTSIHFGEQEEVRRAAAIVDGNWRSSTRSVHAWLRVMQEQANRGEWRLSPPSPTKMSGLAECLGTVSGTVVDKLLG
jgi:hypothetical protein